MFQLKWLARFVFLLSALMVAPAWSQSIPNSSFLKHFEAAGFVDQHGQAFAPENLLGKVVLFNFIYTKCAQVCPLQTKQLARINQTLSSRYQQKITFIAISLDSQFDTPTVLKQYAKAMKADQPNMLFLSGSFEAIKDLQNKLHLFGNPNNPAHPKIDLAKLKTKAKEEVLTNHMSVLWAVGKNGQLLQQYSASPMDVKRVEAELKQLADL